MKKSEFVKTFKDESPVEMTNKEAQEVVNAFLSVIERGITQEEEVSLSPLGKFVTVERAARKGRNPQTGEEIQIPARQAVKFKPSKTLKESL